MYYTDRTCGQTPRWSMWSLLFSVAPQQGRLFTCSKAVPGALQRNRTIVSSHGEVDTSDYSSNQHHGDSLYGNHPSPEQMPPVHHRGIFQWFSEAKSNISKGVRKDNVNTFAVCVAWLLFSNSNAYDLEWRVVFENTTASMSLNAPLSIMTLACIGFEPKSGAALKLPQVVALFVLLSVDISRTRVGKHFLEGGWERIILIVTPPCLSDKTFQFLLECILQPSMGGCIHNHQVLIMCQTIMSQSLASHVRKLALPPLRCVTVCKWKKAKVWELDLMEKSQSTVLKQSEWHL